MTHPFLTGLALSAALFIAPAALAGEGHDHDAAPAAAAGTALPRFAAVSELFELVGIVDGTRLTVYLDRHDDNAPVAGATVALELDGTPVALTEGADGSFEGTLAEALPPGVVPVTATITAGPDTDLLAGELDVHEAAHDDAPPAPPWARIAPWAALAAAGGIAALWAARRAAARRTHVGGAA